MTEPLLELKGLSKFFTVETNFFGRPKSTLKAVDGLSFAIQPGEALGLVGESGCGKTTVGKMIVGLYTPTAGEILFGGTDLAQLSASRRRVYCRDLQLIFQDPYSSLNPRMTIGDIIAEPIRINRLLPGDQINDRVSYLLNSVGLSANYRNRFAHEFSGGQRQRIGIARALAMRPKLIVCDEPVSALDVSVQAQVLNLLDELRDEFGLTYLFIAHGLNVVKHISDRVGVMYLGKLVELAPKDELYNNPLHPYTKALMSAIPVTSPTQRRTRILLEGDVTSPIDPPPGCRFCTRCFAKTPSLPCDSVEPTLKEIGSGHFAACHLL
ncbi:MAG: ATP-binding cassette domain-containing protein [Coriobacteriales bacterium]|jgi:peptide/nickel transport system ATP-binding protein|nr:ATP-binding cassette domain-containing protein [Coriobacteriales bacterium]